MNHTLSWFNRLTHRPQQPAEPGGLSNPHPKRPQILNGVKSSFLDLFGMRGASSPIYDSVDDDDLFALNGPAKEGIPAQGSHAPNLSGDQVSAGLAEAKIALIKIGSKWIASRESRDMEPVVLEKRAWRKRVEQEEDQFLRSYKIFTNCQRKSTSPLLKRLTAKFTFPLRMWLGGASPRLRLLRHLTLCDSEHERILEYFQQAYKIMDLLRGAESALENADGELQALLEEVEAIFDRLGRRFQSLYFQLIFWILSVVELSAYFLFGFGNSSEYPQGQRYRCTTMPWTIWPALVVLWGVCWMFYDIPYDTCWNFEGISCLDRMAVADDYSLDLDLSSQPSEDYFAANPFYDVSFAENPLFLPEMAGIGPVHQGEAFMLPTTPDLSIPQDQCDSMSSQSPISLANTASSPETQPPASSQDEALPALSRAPKTRNSRASRNAKLQCPICHKNFRRTDVLRRHCNEQHSDGSGGFFCSEEGCKRSRRDYGFKRQEQLERHRMNCKHTKKSRASRHRAFGQSPEIPSNHMPDGTEGYGMRQQHERASSSDRDSDGTISLDNGPTCRGSTILGLRRIRDELEEDMEDLKAQFESKKQRFAQIESFIQNFENGLGGTGGQRMDG